MLNIAVVLTAAVLQRAACSIDGLTYMDDMNRGRRPNPRDKSECNNLYWYPRPLPPHCFAPDWQPPTERAVVTTTPQTPIYAPIPYPIPVPAPVPVPMPGPYPFMPFPVPQPLPAMMPAYPQYPQQYQPPLMAAMPGMTYQPMPQRYGGLMAQITSILNRLFQVNRGSAANGVNILPFSDVYTDMENTRKRKKALKKLGEWMHDLDY